jgi:hypothetical protein
VVIGDRDPEIGSERHTGNGSGVAGWARRHRPSLGGLVGLLVVAGLATGYVVNRPPAAAPVVPISIVGYSELGSGDVYVKGGVTRRYQATSHAAGDIVTLLGVVGPGLSHPTSSMGSVKFRLPKVGSLGATVDCSDEKWWHAKDADYLARVHGTDTHGRKTTYDVPLGATPLGPANTFWHMLVRQVCLPAFFRTLGPAAASGSTVQHQVNVTLTLRNPSQHALWVSVPDYSDGLVDVVRGPWTALPARATTRLQMPFRAVDCTQGTPGVPIATTPNGEAGKAKALPAYVSDKAKPVEGESVGVWVGLDPASEARLDRQIGALCPSGTR